MITHEGLDRNFTFMVLEIRRQLEATYELMGEPNVNLTRRVVSRDNYIDTLKGLIQRKCLSYFRHTPTLDERSAAQVTAVNVVAANLERIADFCVNIVQHIRKLDPPQFLQRFDYKPYFDELLQAASIVVEALTDRDTSLAMRLCQSEAKLDHLYEVDYQRIRNDIRTGEDTDNLLVSLQVFHYLERMGDSLLNIGEAVLYASTGEKLKLHEYLRLSEVMGTRHPQSLIHNYSLAFNYETKSGARIGKIEEKGGEGNDFEGIFKKGQSDKLRKEKENIERWGAILPDIPPKVLEFWENEGDAALLLEFLDGFTFQEVIINGEVGMVREAQQLLHRSLGTVWSKTRGSEPAAANFLDQAKSRLEDIFTVHERFRDTSYAMGDLRLSSLNELLDQGTAIEKELVPPFSVLIHGDFNNDNIIYNYREHKVHFIDLHRSRESDYVQDVSIFLVSNFRMPMFRPDVRTLLNEVCADFYKFASEFARKQGDLTFNVRLAFGLARGLLTSTRFELDPEFSKEMYMRSLYLLRKVIRHEGKPWEDFTFSWEVIEY